MEHNTAANDATPGHVDKLIGTLPFRSIQRDDAECNLDVSIWQCSWNPCEYQRGSCCDTAGGIYYGSAEDELTKFCTRHYYEMHFAADAPYVLVGQVTTGA